MKRKITKWTITAGLLLFTPLVYAQNEVDALRYSNIGVAGTGRSLGMGGAFGAIGADHSGFWNNPAGLAVYKTSSIDFTLGFNDRLTRTTHYGTSDEDAKFRTNVQSLGFVGVKNAEKNDQVRFFFGFGLANLSNYNQSVRISGETENNTLLDVFAAQANGINYDQVFDYYPFGAGLAWETYLIDPLDSASLSYIPVENQGRIRQAKSIDRSGRQSETTFAFGANINERWMLGATLGIRSVFFRENAVYSEEFLDSQVLSKYVYSEDINASGNGFNLRLGAIYRVSEWLRAGISWHSPTRLTLSDAYSTSMTSYFRNGVQYQRNSPELISNYNVRMPARYIANAAFLMGKYGVISADYEFTDFSNIRMGSTGLSSDYDYAAENETIETVYRDVHRVRVGTEIRLADVWRARAGVIYQTSPFINGVAINEPSVTYTLGGGYRKGAFYADLAGMFNKTSESYWLYDAALADETRVDNTLINIVASIGLKF